MSHRTAGTAAALGHFNLPRGWVILGLGFVSWLAVVGVISIATAAFQALSAVFG